MQELTSAGMLATGQGQSIAFTNDNGKIPLVPAYTFVHYRNCFAAMYNKDLELSLKSGMGALSAEIGGLLDVAQYLGCLPVVARSVENILMRFGQEFFRHISRTPTVWINRSLLMKSEAIFREAVIHTVGQWNSLTDVQKSNLSKEVMPLLEKKAAIMLKRGKEVEARVIALYPSGIQRREGDDAARTGYAADVM